MGFSVSGTFMLLLLATFIALGAITTTGANTMEAFSDARSGAAERLDAIHETDVTVTSVALSVSADCTVEADVAVNNTGSSTLSLETTTLMVDNSVQTDWRDEATVGEDASTDLWLPGERLTVTLSGLSHPADSVSVVTKTGVTDREITEEHPC